MITFADDVRTDVPATIVTPHNRQLLREKAERACRARGATAFYDALAASLENLAALETAVDGAIAAKNRARERPLAPYYRDYALLQEVTKGALRRACGSLTLAHTDSEIPGGSVTSFYEVGLAMELYAKEDLVPYKW